MKNTFKIGDKIQFEHTVTKQDIAQFDDKIVHEVYATFAIARDAEWTSRQFVLDMKEDDEEGIGTFVYVTHHAPALLHQLVLFEAEIERLQGNAIDCKFTAYVGDRLVADGKTGQKILKKEKLKKYFSTF